MRLRLTGHNYKYAVEQMLSTLFPGERPEYLEEGDSTEDLAVSLHTGTAFTTASCLYRTPEGVFRGKASVKNEKLTGGTETDRLCQYVIKNAVYRAVRASGYPRPPWGALTGVRPGKLMHGILNTSHSEKEAVSRFVREYDVTPQRARLCCETTLATRKAEESLERQDICLYIGIPFCPTRCAYCSFVSQAVEKNMKLMEPFLSALRQEIRAVARQVKKQGLRVVSIYAGGGTPTTLSAEQLEELCTCLEQEFDLGSLREYTVEAGRPDTITMEKLKVLRTHGVDRVSVNPQTMSDSVLRAIGRNHTAADIYTALEMVRKTGGFAVNMDIIAGLPTDTVQGFRNTLDTVLSLQCENITVHTLSLKKGSRLILNSASIPSAEEVAVMLQEAYPKLYENGYTPYYLYRQKNMSGGFENTGWTRDGYVNLYNICMMEELCGILAAGGGGSTKLIRAGGGRNLRITAPKYPLEYIQQIEKTCEDKRKIGEFYGV